MKERNHSSILEDVLSCEGMATETILDAAIGEARKRCQRRRAGLCVLSILIAALPLGWLASRHFSDGLNRGKPVGPGVVQSPSADILVKTVQGPSLVLVVTERGANGEGEREPAWRVRTEDLPPAQHVVRVSDDDLLLLAGRKESGSAALVYAADGLRFLVADATAREAFR